MRIERDSDRIADWSASLPLLLAAAALALTACSPDDRAADDGEPSPRPIRVVEARPAAGVESLRLPGALRARQRAELAFLNSGYLTERPAFPGQQVAGGDTLARLYNPALQPGVASARADVRQARTRLEQLEVDTRRQASLVERDLVSEDALDQTRTRRDEARAALEQAEAEMARAQATLEDAVLRAPFSGRVTRVRAEPGDFVAAGEPIVSLADPGRLEVEVHVRPAIAAAMTADDPAELLMADTGRRLGARIAEIGRAAPGLPVPVVIVPDEEDPTGIEPGAPVHALIEIGREVLPAVPLAAIIDPGTGYGRVFRIVDGRAEKQSVLAGRLVDGWVEIRGDVAAGDRIVVAGQANLLDGEAVRVLP
ncbi:MAG: efflux RND transporter periplasmic adaptor subunit [Candidatus Wenzhouxiangella sp. M2_3B_020]